MALSASANHRIVWAIRLLLALAFGAAGAAKLAGVPQMVQTFEVIGIGQWFRYVTALVELTGAVLLFFPATVFLASLLLGLTMVVAASLHLLVMGGTAVPAIVLAVLCGFVAYRLRPAAGVLQAAGAAR